MPDFNSSGSSVVLWPAPGVVLAGTLGSAVETVLNPQLYVTGVGAWGVAGEGKGGGAAVTSNTRRVCLYKCVRVGVGVWVCEVTCDRTTTWLQPASQPRTPRSCWDLPCACTPRSDKSTSR
jgi:hypothetical protein